MGDYCVTCASNNTFVSNKVEAPVVDHLKNLEANGKE